MKTTRAEVFRSTLHEAAEKIGMAEEDIAKRLWLRQGNRKWLRRIWQHGLDRPNKRTQQDLTKLAMLLWGDHHIERFWVEDAGKPLVDSHDAIHSYMGFHRSVIELQTLLFDNIDNAELVAAIKSSVESLVQKVKERQKI